MIQSVRKLQNKHVIKVIRKETKSLSDRCCPWWII